jgi:hypothetical protein
METMNAAVAGIESSALAEWLRTSPGAIPTIEALHVMAVALVFGTILIVDLRLLGFPNTRRSFVRTSGELLSYTWAGFGLAVVTGVLMFVANAATYVGNALFLWKMAALVGAGINMAVFELVTSRGVQSWDRDVRAPPAAVAAAVVSIVIWTSVIVLGRWVGFVPDYDFSVPENVELEFEF